MKEKRVKKIVAFMMALTFLVSVPVSEVHAQEPEVDVIEIPVTVGEADLEYGNSAIRPQTTMFDCDITIAFRKEGLVMTFSTACLGIASVIGVKDIKVQKKRWYGWETVLTSNGGECYNDDAFAGDLIYSEAEVGQRYRILCTHYANVDVYEEYENDSGSFKFIY